MQFLFVFSVLVGTWYFIIRRRRFDLFALAFLSSVVYFSPGFFGFDIFGTPLDRRAYGVYVLVLAGILAVAVLREAAGSEPAYAPVSRGVGILPGLSAALALLVLMWVVANYGLGSFFVSRSRSGIPGTVYIVWRVLASVAVVFAMLARRRGPLLLALVPLGMTFLARDRTSIVLVCVAVLTEYYRRKGRMSVAAGSRRIVLPMLLFVLAMGTAKLVHSAVSLWYMRGTTEGVSAVFRTNLPRKLMANAEPFATQAILNEVLARDFYVGPSHLVGVFYQVWPTPSSFGHSSGAFNEIYQAELFPEMSRGTMAYNFWAEAIASGGVPMLLLFLVVYLGGLVLFNHLSHSTRLWVRGLALLMGAYWTFYIHRNSMASIIAYERHILYFGMLVVLAGALIPTTRARRAARPRLRPLGAPAPAPGGRAWR